MVPDLGLTFLLAASAVLIAGIARGFSGFGSAMIMSPALAVLYDPVTAVLVLHVLETAALVQMLPVAVREADRKVVVPLGLAAAATIPLGVYLLVTLDAELLQRGIGAVVLAFVVVLAGNWRYRGPVGIASSAGLGAVAGTLGGATGVAGPPVILFLMAGPFPPHKIRANITGFFAISTAVLWVAYLASGVFTFQIALKAIWLLPIYIIGITVGARLFGRVSEPAFRRVVLVLLAAVAGAAILA